DGAIPVLEVIQEDLSSRREITRGPGTAAASLEDPVPYFVAARNRCRFLEVQRKVVIGFDPGLAKISDSTATTDERTARGCFQRCDFNMVPAQSKVRLGGRGDRPVAVEGSVHLAQQHIAVEAAPQQRVSHVGGNIAHDKV